MMAEDWDLFAIVRSCQSATNTATTKNPPNTTNTTHPSLANSTVKEEEEEYEAFSFPNIVQPMTNEFQELNQLFTSFNPTTNTTTPSGCGINPNSPDFAGQQQSHHLPVLAPLTTHTSIWPHFVPEASTSSSFNRFHDQQQQQQQQQQQSQHVQKQHSQLQPIQKQEFQATQSNSALVLPNAQPQTPRSRKRKSQQKKMVCHVTADNVSADLWAWRKYGQKPIKGSPYPRNYYRCSSSKGCAARKQVERSNTEADMFIVTYTGDHTHPRPTHRNSLAGSTRTKQHQPSSQVNTLPSSSSSPATHSPVSTSADPPENEEGDPDPDPDPEIESDDEGEDEADIMLPNPDAMATNVLLDLDHFDGGCSTGGSLPDTDPV